MARIETFAIVPGQAGMLWGILAFVTVMMILVIGLLFVSARGATASRFEVSAAGIRLRGDLYGRLVPAAALRGDASRVVDLRAAPDLVPRRRTLGTAVPGYAAGWFRLRNGEKALLYLTDRRRALYVPTTAGYSLLLSPQDPERMLARVRAVAGGD